ncbi:hypothetical protein [Legionella norrlandica]|nr:hypothetical protein [Legionella norrlandica]
MPNHKLKMPNHKFHGFQGAEYGNSLDTADAIKDVARGKMGEEKWNL